MNCLIPVSLPLPLFLQTYLRNLKDWEMPEVKNGSETSSFHPTSDYVKYFAVTL